MKAIRAVLVASSVFAAALSASREGAAQQPAQSQPQPGQPQPPQPGQFQPQPAQPQPNPFGTMGSGGVAPPAPLQPGNPNTPQTQPQNDYTHDLDHSKDKDSGRGLSWFWVDVYGGFEQAALHAFNASSSKLSLDGLIKTSGSGGVIGAGLGARLLFFTIGVRGRMGFFQPWQIGRVGPELGFRFPLGIFEPHFDVGGGYAALANLDSVVPEQVSVHGGYGRLNAGLDVYPNKFLSLGGEASFDFLGLQRSALKGSDLTTAETAHPGLNETQRTLLGSSGTGLGATFAIVGIVGVHL